MDEHVERRVVPLPKKTLAARKTGINRNKEGSVRKINGKVYLDFMYLGKRVREPEGLKWTAKNASEVRKKRLDLIMAEIRTGTFRFAQWFPESRNAGFFGERERLHLNVKVTPEEVRFEPEARDWYRLHRAQGVRGRTMLGYKSQLENYLIPLLGGRTFGAFNKVVFRELVLQARALRPLGNATINKLFVPLRMICDHAAEKYEWGPAYHPFHKWEKLEEGDPVRRIMPLSLPEQKRLRRALPGQWLPYFDLAFSLGLRPGEQMAIEPGDIDWERGLLHISRAVTVDERGKRCLDACKNRYSQRTIHLKEPIVDALKRQKAIHDRLGGAYLFCGERGGVIHYNDLRASVWVPTLERAGLALRPMGLTRHTFATTALALGENPAWIAHVMGHRDAEMVIKVYTKYVENMRGTVDGDSLAGAYRAMFSGP